MAGAGSSSQFIGGLVVALLYVVIGLLGAIESVLVFRRTFRGRWKQIFWSWFLVVIVAFYHSATDHLCFTPGSRWSTNQLFEGAAESRFRVVANLGRNAGDGINSIS